MKYSLNHLRSSKKIPEKAKHTSIYLTIQGGGSVQSWSRHKAHSDRIAKYERSRVAPLAARPAGQLSIVHFALKATLNKSP